MKSKKLHQSKTFWFNALTVVVVVASFFGYEQNPEVAAKTQQLVVGLAPIVNILLRLVTNTAVRI